MSDERMENAQSGTPDRKDESGQVPAGQEQGGAADAGSADTASNGEDMIEEFDLEDIEVIESKVFA